MKNPDAKHVRVYREPLSGLRTVQWSPDGEVWYDEVHVKMTCYDQTKLYIKNNYPKAMDHGVVTSRKGTVA